MKKSTKSYLHYLKLLLVMLLILNMTSCKKYLMEKSNSALVVPMNLNDFQSILDDAGYMNFQLTPSFGEASSDDYFLLPEVYNSMGERERYIYTWKPYDYYFQNDWSINYFPVYNANLSLEGLQNIPQTEANKLAWNNVKGSALFFRAYSFLNLVWVFAKAYDEDSYKEDLGIALRLESDFNVPSVRSSVKDCYERIITDATEASLYLPEFSQHPMRPSQAAAFGLLARTYLSMRMYDSALKYSDKCLKIKSTLMDFNSSPEVDVNNWISFQPFNSETIFYSEMNSSISCHASYQALIDTTLYSSYDSNDLRKTAYFSPTGNYFLFRGNYSGDAYSFFSGIATDEMFLTRAECYARTGNIDSALADLNGLLSFRWRKNNFTPLSATSPEEALRIILKERRKELLMRGLRWADIKRLNKEGVNIILHRVIDNQVITLPPNDEYYALPLPIDIINANPKMQQN